MAEMTREELSKYTKKKIKEYVNEHNENNIPISSFKQIIEEIEIPDDSRVSEKTMYRYFEELGLKKIESGYFDFTSNHDTCSLWALCDEAKYNKYICFYLENDFFASLLAEKLNESLWCNFAKENNLWEEHYSNPRKMYWEPVVLRKNKEIDQKNARISRTHFYSVAIGKIVICFYYYKKNDDMSLKRSIILKEVENIGKRIKINIVEQ